jgi:cytoskeletal protein CcmA (bactofilin family)
MKSWIPLLLATGFVAGTIQMASAVDNVTVKLGSQTSSSQFFVKDSADNAVLTVNADNTTAVLGTLSVSGAATMSSTISVTGASTLVGDIQLTGVISDNDSDITLNDGVIVVGDISDNNSDITLNDGVIVVGDISDNNSDITLNDGVIIVGAISDNDSAVFVNDDLIIAGAISDNDSAVFLNDDVYITGTISDNSTNGSVTIQNLAGSRRADIRDNATDFTLGIDNSTVLLTSTGGAILPANATPGIMFTILVASAQNQLSLKTGSTSVLVTTTYLDNGTVTVGKSDNSTSLDNGTQTLCVAATLNFYQCFTHGGSGNDN